MASSCVITDSGISEANLAYANGVSAQFSRLVVGDGASRVTGSDGSGNGSQATFTFSLLQTAVAPESVRITAQSGSAVLIVTDDGNGNLIGDIGSGNNTVDYATGDVDVTFVTPPDLGATVQYSYWKVPATSVTALVNQLWSGAIMSARWITDATVEVVAMIPEGAPATGAWDLTEFGLYTVRGSSETLFAYGVRDVEVKEWSREHLCRLVLTLSSAPQPTPVFENNYPGAWALNFGNANILCNDRFDHWPYGTSFSGASAVDKGTQAGWKWGGWSPGSSASIEVSRQAGNVTDYAMRIKDSRMGAQVGYIIQEVPVPKAYQGRQLTLRISVRGEDMGSITDYGLLALIYDRDESGETIDAASFVVPTTAFGVRSLTTTVPSSITSMAVAISSPSGYYIDVDWAILTLEDDESYYGPNKREYPERYTVEATEPAETTAGMLWLDTANSLLKIRDSANTAWLTLGAWAAYLGTHGNRHADGAADELELGDLADDRSLLVAVGAAHGGAYTYLNASGVVVYGPAYFMSDDAALADKEGIYISAATTVILSSSGAVNQLDAGAVAQDTWYYLFAIKNPTTGATGYLFSTSYVSPTMPAGYTKKRLFGVARTKGSSTDLMKFRCLSEGHHRIWMYHADEFDGDFGLELSTITDNTNWNNADFSTYRPLGLTTSNVMRLLCKVYAESTGSGDQNVGFYARDDQWGGASGGEKFAARSTHGDTGKTAGTFDLHAFSEAGIIQLQCDDSATTLTPAIVGFEYDI